MTAVLMSMRGSLMYWQAWIRPMIWPLGEFLLSVWWSSPSVHPLGTRKRSSLRIASAFAKSSRPFNNVQKPILFVRKRSGDEDGLRTRELNPSVRFNLLLSLKTMINQTCFVPAWLLFLPISSAFPYSPSSTNLDQYQCDLHT